MTGTKLKTNTFYYLAEQYRKAVTEEEKIELQDMTNTFFKEIQYMIGNKELVMININGKVRGAKSTNGIALAHYIFQCLKQTGQKGEKEEFSMKNIARDEQEYSAKMRNHDTRHTVILTDESNALENTGENVTAERALQSVFSNVQASRYVHRVNCSPKELVDDNADILLTCIALDRETGKNLCKLYYKYVEGLNEHTQLLGHVYIDVNHIIENWKNIETTYYKKDRTKQEEEMIKKIAKEDFYVEYMIKKHEKMELITKEGIFRPRILTSAAAIKDVLERLKPLTKLNIPINTNIIKNYIKSEMRKRKIPLSIVGEELASRECAGIIEMYRNFHKYNMLRAKYKDAGDKVKEYQTEEVMKEIKNSIEELEQELTKYAQINERYHNEE